MTAGYNDLRRVRLRRLRHVYAAARGAYLGGNVLTRALTLWDFHDRYMVLLGAAAVVMPRTLEQSGSARTVRPACAELLQQKVNKIIQSIRQTTAMNKIPQ